jgi:hypothetical protein
LNTFLLYLSLKTFFKKNIALTWWFDILRLKQTSSKLLNETITAVTCVTMQLNIWWVNSPGMNGILQIIITLEPYGQLMAFG